MYRLARWLAVLGVNAVPAGGLALGGWSAATVLAVYWLESLLASLLVALRAVLHRRLTRKRGHDRRWTVSTDRAGRHGIGIEGLPPLGQALVGGVGFSAAHGIFLAVFLVGVLGVVPERRALLAGCAGVAAFQLAGFAADLPYLRSRPFAWIRRESEALLGRVVLLHLAIVAGAALVLWRRGPDAFFLPFVLLKAAADLGGLLTTGREDRPPSEDPPRWLTAILGRSGRDGAFATAWRKRQAEEALRAQADEADGP